MFAEEIGGNATRRKQEEQKRRRRQLKQQQQQQRKAEKQKQQVVSTKATESVSSATVESTSVSIDIPLETETNKPTVVSKALLLRAERAERQLKENSAKRIQSIYRAHSSNSALIKKHSSTLTQRLEDLSKVKVLIAQKTGNRDFIPPSATCTLLCQQLLFLTKSIPYKRKDGKQSIIILRDDQQLTSNFQKIVELIILPSSCSKDVKMNPFLSPIGQRRLKGLIRLALVISAQNAILDDKIWKTCSDLILSLMSKPTHPTILNLCYNLLLPSSPQVDDTKIVNLLKGELPIAKIGAPLDLISFLRHHLLFSVGGEPIPPNAYNSGEACILKRKRQCADSLFQMVLKVIQNTSNPKERSRLLVWLMSEIMTIPLLSWKVSVTSLLERDQTQQIFIISMINAFTNRHAESLTAGEIQSVLFTDIPLRILSATPLQCLLANLNQILMRAVQLNGSDPSKLDVKAATIYFQFIANILDTVSLATLTTRDSVVEWNADGTCIVISPVIIEHCKLILAPNLVRRLFHFAIDEKALKVRETLQTKTESDLKYEKDLEAAGFSAVALAGKEARINRNKSLWSSSGWAAKLFRKTAGNTKPSVKQSVGFSGDYIAKSQLSDPLYSPDLFLVLCRVYAIVLARWGGMGGKDIVSRKEIDTALLKADVSSQSVLNVLCFSTPILQACWAMMQSEKTMVDCIDKFVHQNKVPIQSFAVRPSYEGAQRDVQRSNAMTLLFLFTQTLSHSLIVTDDTEIFDMEKPLPLHHLRRCILILKELLYRACTFDMKGQSNPVLHESNYFGLALVNSAGRTMRDLFDRSSRRPIAIPKFWLVDDLLDSELRNCKTEQDYISLLSTPVLRVCPFLVSFKRRLRLFERICYKNRVSIQGESSTNPFHSNPLRPGIPIRITRGRILEDGLATMNHLGRNLRQRLSVQYFNEAGARETGIDAGGLFKEFWTDLCAIAFDPNYALFSTTEENCMYPSPASKFAHGLDHLVLFEFLGRILGKALYEGITVNPQFAHFFLSFLRGNYNYFHMLADLSTIDKQLYDNLLFLKTYENDAEDLCLTFTVGNNHFGGNQEINLIPKGNDIIVTNENKHRYIGLVAKHYVVDRTKEQSEAFCRGLWEVIDITWLSIFNEPELQVLISGPSNGNIDIDDLRRNCRYAGGFTGIEPVLHRFWKVVASFTPKEQADLLRFVTSCERPPPLGFSSMNPPFTIQRVGILLDGDKLPTSSTCFNILKLPTYSSQKVMKERLLYAIQSGAGFELS